MKKKKEETGMFQEMDATEIMTTNGGVADSTTIMVYDFINKIWKKILG